MNSSITPEQAAALAAPFPPEDVDWRPLDSGTQVAAYVDARVVSNRLNDVLGPGEWEYEWLPLVVSPGAPRTKNGQPPPHDVVWLVKGTLTIGGVSKSDIGEGDTNETSKAAVSDGLKRAAVHFGIGAYLYSLPRQTARIEDYRIPPDELRRLRATLPVPVGYVPPVQAQPRQERATAPQGVTAGERERIAAVADRAPVMPATGSTATEPQLKAMYAIGRTKLHWNEGQLKAECARLFNGRKPNELNRAEASQFIDMLQAEKAA